MITDEVTLENIAVIIEDNLIPSGSRVFTIDTGKQVYPASKLKSRIDEIRKQIEDDTE